MAITHVVRGEDHISNTPRQVLLYEAFGWRPPTFAHVSLVMGPDHAPLSKRHGATSVAEFRTRGYLPEALTNYLALIGWSPGDGQELLPLEELAARFRLEDVGHSAGVFDLEKLAWANRHYLKQAQPERLVVDAARHLREAGWLTMPTAADQPSWPACCPRWRARSIGWTSCRRGCDSCSTIRAGAILESGRVAPNSRTPCRGARRWRTNWRSRRR
jgi:glutamyl/glutaminyl-tRNA synthetase